MHSGQWADLTADRSEEEAVREVCQLSGRDETFRFADVFDVAHFRKELRPLGVEHTVSFDDFLEQGGSIDTLFLLNTAFQPGGAWVRRIFAEPLLHCRDDEHFNRFVKAFDGREVFVKRVICLAADASNTSVHLDGEKFEREMREALKYGSRLGFQLYFWSGPERTRFKLHWGQLGWLPPLWRVLKFHPHIERLADATVRSFQQPGHPFVAVHWRWRDLDAGGLMEYYETELVQHYARAAMPEELYESLVSCVPEHLHCANLFVTLGGPVRFML
ncbi:unnamed protein product [Symbiodinium sp. CCMP2456]|nr:unnamed protein product [Symbiodinium sp. CCMP2456]